MKFEWMRLIWKKAQVVKFELVFTSAFLYLLFSLSIYFSKSVFPHQDIDSAGLVHLIQNISEGKGFVSSIFSSAYSLFPLLETSVEGFKNSAFDSIYADTSFFRWHAYLIAYPMAFLVLLGIDSVNIAIGAVLAGLLAGVLAPSYWLSVKTKSAASGFFYLLFLISWSLLEPSCFWTAVL